MRNSEPSHPNQTADDRGWPAGVTVVSHMIVSARSLASAACLGLSRFSMVTSALCVVAGEPRRWRAWARARGPALVTHLIKTGVRMGVNTSPEPFSNIIVSLIENLAVAGMVVFAVLHPVPAAILAAALLVGGLILVIFLASRIRRFWRNRRERRLARQAGGPRTRPLRRQPMT